MKNKILILTLFLFIGGCATSYKSLLPNYGKIPAAMSLEIREGVERLYSADPVERATGMWRLGMMESDAESAIPYLIAFLYDSSTISWPEESEVYLFFQDHQQEISFMFNSNVSGSIAAWALSRIGESALDELDKVFHATAWHYEPIPVGNAGLALSNMGKPATELLIHKLEKGNWDIRSVAAMALGYSPAKDIRAVEPLVRALNDCCIDIEAAYALGNIGDTRAIKPLMEYWSRNAPINPRAVRSAMVSLGKLKATEAVELLIFYLRVKFDVLDIRPDVHQALFNITGQDFGYDWDQWQVWWNAHKANFKFE